VCEKFVEFEDAREVPPDQVNSAPSSPATTAGPTRVASLKAPAPSCSRGLQRCTRLTIVHLSCNARASSATRVCSLSLLFLLTSARNERQHQHQRASLACAYRFIPLPCWLCCGLRNTGRANRGHWMRAPGFSLCHTSSTEQYGRDKQELIPTPDARNQVFYPSVCNSMPKTSVLHASLARHISFATRKLQRLFGAWLTSAGGVRSVRALGGAQLALRHRRGNWAWAFNCNHLSGLSRLGGPPAGCARPASGSHLIGLTRGSSNSDPSPLPAPRRPVPLLQLDIRGPRLSSPASSP